MNSGELTQIEKRHVWHPFTQMREWEAEEPLFIVSGHGAKLIDIDGKEYWDANSSLWVNIHGHGRAEINDVIAGQLEKIAHSTMLGLTHPLAAQLAQRLISIAPPGLNRVFYSDSGSTAVEIALKMAYQYQCHQGRPEKSRFIALEESYHGDTIGSVSVGGIGLFHGIFRRLLFPVDFAPCPARSADAVEAASKIKAILKQSSDEIAAIIVEPLVQGASGMLVSPPGFLRRVRELCDQYDVLLIVDEVATGFGRTGTMFACEQEDVSPDLMCVAKGITGGYLPLAATLTTEKVYNAFLGERQELKTFFHGHSYTGNPLACAAAIASIDIFEQDNVIASLPAKIEHVRTKLQSIAKLSHVREVRQCGLMVGIELAFNRQSPFPFELNIGAKVCSRARVLGLITRPLGDVVVFLPPLCCTAEELASMLSIIETAIDQVTTEHAR
jgi:adenosylmethionine-8-amino-7-oxononanoate aminotransferase